MNAEDRKVVDEIHAAVRENVKVTRALSSSLIGRVNGDTYDEEGGRMGRLEKAVRKLETWRWWLMTTIITLLLGCLGFTIANYVGRHP